MNNWNKAKSDFDRDFARTQAFIYIWFAFVAAVIVSVLCGGAFVVYKLMVHFGIMGLLPMVI